jgi:hypothetical protein
MREHNKRWLISKLKSSGSKRERVDNGRYADERHLQKQADPEYLPHHESFRSTYKFYNGKINLGPLVRFLRTQAGNDWDAVYSAIISRIPTKLLEYKDVIDSIVATQVEIIDGKPWNKKEQKFIWTGEKVGPMHADTYQLHPQFIEFYVHPATNKLMRIEESMKKAI